MALPKPVRLMAAATMAVFFFLALTIMRSSGTVKLSGSGTDNKIDDMVRDPNLDETLEPPEPLHRVDGHNYDADNEHSDRINATLLSLVRNRELSP